MTLLAQHLPVFTDRWEEHTLNLRLLIPEAKHVLIHSIHIYRVPNVHNRAVFIYYQARCSMIAAKYAQSFIILRMG